MGHMPLPPPVWVSESGPELVTSRLLSSSCVDRSGVGVAAERLKPIDVNFAEARRAFREFSKAAVTARTGAAKV